MECHIFPNFTYAFKIKYVFFSHPSSAPSLLKTKFNITIIICSSLDYP